jgi:bis(5'-nucleosyl)-tetraphosphatase (symmetrical)
VPQWSADDVLALSRELTEVLTDPQDGLRLLAALGRGVVRLPWSGGLAGLERWATAAAVLTRARLLAPDGGMVSGFSGPLEAAPEGAVPWFKAPGRRTRNVRVVFGHWSTLGLYDADNVVGLDTGCVWGQTMTAWRLEDQRLVQVAARE